MPSDPGHPPPPDVLDVSVHAAILAVIIADFLDHVAPAAAPRCYLLGGQPGAGKTGLRKAIEAALGEEKPVLVDPDELRIYHPGYVAFVEANPLTAASRTHADAAAWADELRMAALARGVNVIVDGTLRSPEWAVQMAEDASDGGYAVEVHAVAVPLEISRQGVRGRLEASFAAQDDPTIPDDEKPLPRDVPEDIQLAAYNGLPDSLEALSRSGHVARIRVATRDGAALADLYGQDDVAAAAGIDPNPFAEALRRERDRPWTGEEIEAYQERAQIILSQMQARLERTEGTAHEALASEMETVRAGMQRVAGEQTAKALKAACTEWVRRVLDCEPGGSGS
jgi:predicted kinase